MSKIQIRAAIADKLPGKYAGTFNIRSKFIINSDREYDRIFLVCSIFVAVYYFVQNFQH